MAERKLTEGDIFARRDFRTQCAVPAQVGTRLPWYYTPQRRRHEAAYKPEFQAVGGSSEPTAAPSGCMQRIASRGKPALQWKGPVRLKRETNITNINSLETSLVIVPRLPSGCLSGPYNGPFKISAMQPALPTLPTSFVTRKQPTFTYTAAERACFLPKLTAPQDTTATCNSTCSSVASANGKD